MIFEFFQNFKILSSPFWITDFWKTAKLSLSYSISLFLHKFNRPTTTKISLNYKISFAMRIPPTMLIQSCNISLIGVRQTAYIIYIYSWTLLIPYPLLNARHILIVSHRRMKWHFLSIVNCTDRGPRNPDHKFGLKLQPIPLLSSLRSWTIQPFFSNRRIIGLFLRLIPPFSIIGSFFERLGWNRINTEFNSARRTRIKSVSR